jgi:hypothetical protein
VTQGPKQWPDSYLWALVRMVELRKGGEPARFRVCWRDEGGRRHYWLTIRRADGSIESRPGPECDGMVEESPSHPLEPT